MKNLKGIVAILKQIVPLVYGAQDAEFEESKHPRAKNGQFGKSSGSAKASSSKGLRLTPDEKSAIASYSGDDFFRINTSLRNGNISPDDQKQVERIDSSIDKSPLKVGTVLYRGLTREDAKKLMGSNLERGKTFSDAAFSSTSTDQWIGSRLGGVTLKIEVGEEASGLDMTKFSSNPQEKETLLPRNAKMTIKGITPPKKPGQPIIVHVKYGN